jgi:hypothetical protein
MILVRSGEGWIRGKEEVSGKALAPDTIRERDGGA